MIKKQYQWYVLNWVHSAKVRLGQVVILSVLNIATLSVTL